MLEFICSHYSLINLKYSFPLFLHILGKHARVKDEDEAMAGEDDRVKLHCGSELGGQGERLISSCSKLIWFMQMTFSKNVSQCIQMSTETDILKCR